MVGGKPCADQATPFYLQILALNLRTSGGRLVGIVRLRTKSHKVCLGFHSTGKGPNISAYFTKRISLSDALNMYKFSETEGSCLKISTDHSTHLGHSFLADGTAEPCDKMEWYTKDHKVFTITFFASPLFLELLRRDSIIEGCLVVLHLRETQRVV
jgi:hypothetical protein